MWVKQFDLLYYLESAPKNVWAEDGRRKWKLKKNYMKKNFVILRGHMLIFRK